MTEQNLGSFNGMVLTGRLVGLDTLGYTLTIIFTIATGGTYKARTNYGVADIPPGYVLSLVFGSQSVQVRPGRL